jgi:hypothetical protein
MGDQTYKGFLRNEPEGGWPVRQAWVVRVVSTGVEFSSLMRCASWLAAVQWCCGGLEGD